MFIKIGPEHSGVRLDAFLASQIEGWSRARLQKLIENEDVLVNHKLSKPSYKLREGDEVEVELSRSANHRLRAREHSDSTSFTKTTRWLS